MKSKSTKLFLGLGILVALLLAAGFARYSFKQAANVKKLPVYGQINNFVLKDSNGDMFDSKVLRGKVWIANFFFTDCTELCPETSMHMASLSRTFDQLPAVKLLSITVNPKNDSPDVLQAYAEQFSKGKNNWIFLTGDQEYIQALSMEQFKLSVKNQKAFHSPYIPLIDRSGNIRGYYNGTETAEINQLFKDINVLLKDRF